MMQNEKRPLTADEIELQQANKRAKLEGGGGLDALASASSVGDDDDSDGDAKPGAPMSKARENRLEQNRKAARESRRRKKLMIEGELVYISFRRSSDFDNRSWLLNFSDQPCLLIVNHRTSAFSNLFLKG